MSASVKAETTLPPRQAAFVLEYLVDLNATAAAIRAGYSEAAASEQGYRLTEHPRVAAAIEAAMQERAERVGLSADRVLSELASLALYDAGEIGAANIRGPADIAKLPVRLRRAIIGWSWDKNDNFTLKMSSKEGALTLIGRHLGIWNDKLHLSFDVAERLDGLRRKGLIEGEAEVTE